MKNLSEKIKKYRKFIPAALAGLVIGCAPTHYMHESENKYDKPVKVEVETQQDSTHYLSQPLSAKELEYMRYADSVYVSDSLAAEKIKRDLEKDIMKIEAEIERDEKEIEKTEEMEDLLKEIREENK